MAASRIEVADHGRGKFLRRDDLDLHDRLDQDSGQRGGAYLKAAREAISKASAEEFDVVIGAVGAEFVT